jgi:hypothetical protein
MAKALDFIPIDLSNRLDADADRVAANRDRKCAEILRQLAAYAGVPAGPVITALAS